MCFSPIRAIVFQYHRNYFIHIDPTHGIASNTIVFILYVDKRKTQTGSGLSLDRWTREKKNPIIDILDFVNKCCESKMSIKNEMQTFSTSSLNDRGRAI